MSALDPLFLDFQLAVAGRYSIEREIGRGGMGVVFLAREVQLDRPVAIKLLPPEHALDETRRTRFVAEARLAAKLSHPNIVPIFAVDEAEGFVYYVMAYVPGETLAERVRRRGPLGGAEAARVMREVAWALAHAHDRGVVHRDVKPDNILLEEGTGRALVADFGIAAALGEDPADGVAGTPEFMSPEQALGKELDARSDLYALGVTAFFVSAGHVPFDGAKPVEILAKHVTEPAPALSTAVSTVPRRFAQVVERCLAKSPAERPASAEQVAGQFGAVLEQRREVPAVLRAFVKRGARLGGGTVLGVGYLGMMTVGLAGARAGLAAALGALGLIGVAIPAVHFVWSARRVTRFGFRHEDIAPAFDAEIEQTREEFEAQHGKGRPGLERFFSRTAKVFGGVALGTTVAGLISASSASALFEPTAMIVGSQVALVGLFTSFAGYRFLRSRRQHADLEWWAKFWNGRIGRWAFAVADRLPGKRASAPALTHRATELSLGLAAEELFESLPREARRELGDVPGLLRQLQDQARRLKERLEVLRPALEDAERAPGGVGRDASLSDVRAAHDEAAERLREVVGALERVRLDLLRLHAGSTSVKGLTTQFGAAADLARELERRIEARAEVERALKP